MPFLYRSNIIIIFCLLSESPSFSQWTWVKGDSVPGNISANLDSLGTKGVFTDSMVMPKLYGSCSWISGKDLYVLGGEYFEESDGYSIDINGMFIYNIDSNKWKWAAGSGLYANTPNVYGTQGIPDSNNFPGERVNATYWTDHDGNFWLFGGLSWGGDHNDLWKYEITSGRWTWMKGPNTAEAPGHYGKRGVPDSLNNPPYRRNSESWTDQFGNLWLFGGYIQEAGDEYRNDLWRFNIANNEWTWMKGDSTYYPVGVYGTLGIFDSVNTPGGRLNSRMHWVDTIGNFYLFGGYTVSPVFGFYQDLWKYNVPLNQWAWLGGGQLTNYGGNYNTICLNNNYPASRSQATGWVDKEGYCWMLGGETSFSNPAYVNGTNDLWKYDPYHNEWYWIDGNNNWLTEGTYGTQGVADVNNEIRSRFGAVSWVDSLNNFWIWGGTYNVLIFEDFTLNDLWRYTPDSTCGVYTGSQGPFDLQQDGFIISPNPASTSINVIYRIYQNAKLTITDAFGIEVKKALLPSTSKTLTIDIGDLEAGIYLLSMHQQNRTLTHKIVITR